MIDMNNLRHSFKKIYNIDLINVENVKNSLELFVQLKINTDPEYIIPTSINNFSFLKDYNLYMKNLNKSISYSEDLELLYIKEPFLKKYKEELFLAINPENFKSIKYTRKHFYFLYWHELVNAIQIVLKPNAFNPVSFNREEFIEKYDYLFEDKDMLSSFVDYKISLFSIENLSYLKYLPNPLKYLCKYTFYRKGNSYCSLNGSKETVEIQREKEQIVSFFENEKLEFPEFLKYYSEKLEQPFNLEQKEKALNFLDYVIKKLIGNKNEIK